MKEAGCRKSQLSPRSKLSDRTVLGRPHWDCVFPATRFRFPYLPDLLQKDGSRFLFTFSLQFTNIPINFGSRKMIRTLHSPLGCRRMKKTFFIVLVGATFLLSAMPAQAKHKASAEDENISQWYLATGIGLSVPLQNWNPGYYLGGGGDFLLGCSFDPHWALQLAYDQWFFTGAGFSTTDFRFLPELKWTPGAGAMKPYFLAGPGLDFQRNYPGTASSTNFTSLLGAGLEFGLSPKSRLFVEGKLDFIFAGSTALDLPLVAGLNVDL